MKPKLPIRPANRAAQVALLLFTSLTAPTALAVDYYWDNNGATAGFGTASGTWAEPTVGDATQGFSTDIAGTTLPVDVTTTGSDITLFGTDANGLGAGTINVSGTVSAQRVDFRAASGAITLSGGTINLTTDVVSRAPGMTINSDITISGDASFIKALNVDMTTTLGGVISGNGDVTFTSVNTNLQNKDFAYLLNGNNTYTGDTFIDGLNGNSRMRVVLGVDDALPSTTVVTIDGGNGAGSGRDQLLQLNGNNQMIAGLTNVPVSLRRQDVQGPGTLTINNTSNYTFSGRLTGALTLVKSGSGTQTLRGSNTYTGTTTVSNGTLELGNLAALGSTPEILLGDGAALVPDLDGLTVAVPITLGTTGTTSTINAPTSGTSGGQVQTLTLNGAISGDGDLTFNGSAGNNSYGTIVLGAASTYTGDTLIDASAVGATCWLENGVSNALPTTTVLTLDGNSGIASGRVVQYDLAGFDQTLAGLQSVRRIARNQFVTSEGSPATLTLNGADDYSFGDVFNYTYIGDPKTTRSQIRGQLSLAKSGAGTFTLSEAHTYTGSTTITGGTLQGEVGGAIASSAVTLDSLGTYGVLVTDNAESWTSSSLTTTGAGTLQFNFGATSPSSSVSPMSISGAADFSAATPLVSVLVDAGLAPGTYPLATWGSLVGTAPTTAELTVSTLAPGTAADLNLNGNTLELVISDTSVDVAKGNNIDDLNLNTSWASGTAPGAADTAVWSNTVLGANSVSLGADLTWGTLSILDPGGLVTINAGNTLTLAGDPTGLLPLIDMSLATQDLTINADLVMDNFGFWDVAAGRTLTVTGAISGTFGPIKAGDGTAIISGPNTYTGETSVDAGTLQLGADDAIPNGAGSGNVFVLGTLDLNGFSDTINSLSGTGIVDNTAASTTSILTIGDDNQPSTFGGILQNTGGTLGLTKIGSDTLTLEGANTLTGPIDVQGGTLAFSNTAPFDNASSLTLAGGTVLQSEVGGASVGTPITLGGTGTTTTVDFPVSGGVGFTLNSVIDGDGNLRIDRSVGDVTAGTIVLGGQSTYAGDTEFDTAGGLDSGSQLTVRLGVDNALPSTTVLTLDGGPGAGSGRSLDFDLNGFDQTLAGLTNVTGLGGRRQEITSTGGPSTLTIDNSANYSFGGSTSGTFSGSPWTARSRLLGDISLVKSGTGIFTLVEVHPYTGDTTVNAGLLSLEAANPSNESSTVTIADSGATLNLNFSGTDTVDKLFIGGTQLAPGEYKAPGSAATGTELVQLSGTGTLTVTTGPVTDPFGDWAATGTLPGTVTFEGDLNGDGVQDGIAFLLGIGNPDDDANSALPTVSEDGSGGLVMTFNCLPSADRGTAELRIGHSNDLGATDAWLATVDQVPDATNAVADNGVTFVVTPGSPTNAVVATIAASEAAGGKLFGRLQATAP